MYLCIQNTNYVTPNVQQCMFLVFWNRLDSSHIYFPMNFIYVNLLLHNIYTYVSIAIYNIYYTHTYIIHTEIYRYLRTKTMHKGYEKYCWPGL